MEVQNIMDNKNILKNYNLEGFVLRDEVNKEKLKIAFVGVGQAGNKMTTKFIELGYYGVLYNTCQEDIDNAVEKIKDLDYAKYKTVKLEGYDGAAKDREIGLQAIRDNHELLKRELLTDENLINADFVWIVVSLGGGTGNGSVATMAQIISGIMRKNKRYKVKKDPKTGKVINIGKATVGVIAAIPDEDSIHKIELNAAEALNEIRKLQDKKLLGSLLLIDNEKLVQDFMNKPDDEVAGIDWVQYGNETTATTLTETTLLTCLPGRETLDAAEFLDIITSPGCLNVGKKKINKNFLDNMKDRVKNDDQEKFNLLIENSFKEQNIFAEGYDYSKCIAAGLSIITNGNVIDTKKSIMIKRSMNKILDNSLIETPHYGVYDNSIFGTSKKPEKNKDEALIYTLAVIKQLPERIIEMTKRALEEKKKRDQMLKQEDDVSLDSILVDIEQDNEDSNLVDVDFDDILSGKGFIDDVAVDLEEDVSEESQDPYDPYDELNKLIEK